MKTTMRVVRLPGGLTGERDLMKEQPLDPSSTGRRRGRKVLEQEELPYWCRSTREGGVNREQVRTPQGRIVWVGCGRSPTEKNAPGGMHPSMETLQVNHINKNVLDNDPVNLEWICSSCHKYVDMQTAKGVSVKGDEYGYGELAIATVPDDEEEDLP